MNRKNKLLITDQRPGVSDVNGLTAATSAKHAREQTVAKWLLGLVADVVQDNNAEFITLTVGANSFSDARAEYPSEKLVAAMSLAIYAGENLGPSNFQIQDLEDELAREVLERGSPYRNFDSPYRNFGVEDATYRRGKPTHYKGAPLP